MDDARSADSTDSTAYARFADALVSSGPSPEHPKRMTRFGQLVGSWHVRGRRLDEPTGEWRDRANGEGFRGNGSPLLDVSGTFPDGSTFKTLAEYKAGLMARKDKFARAFSTKLLTYALCRPVGYADHKLVDALTEELRRNDYRIQPLIHAIVASDAFNTK